MRLLPLLFLSYAIAYVDRINVSLANWTMSKDLPGFERSRRDRLWCRRVLHRLLLARDSRHSARRKMECSQVDQPNHDFLGDCSGNDSLYSLPCTRSNLAGRAHSSRNCHRFRAVGAASILAGYPGRATQSSRSLNGPDSPFILQFFSIRFLLGLAEAGFFPGVIVYLTHWFPARDRARALSWFFIATPVAQFVSPKLSYYLLRIGTTETFNSVYPIHYPTALGNARAGNGCTLPGAFRL